jgi:cytochrome b561
MQFSNSPGRYGAVPQAFHWLTLVCVVGAWPLGWFIDDFPKSAEGAVLLIHMTLGECVLALLVARLVWRFVDPSPPLEATRWNRLSQTAVRVSHYSLYALLLLVPIAGIVAQLKRGHALPVFAVTSLVSPWPADRAVARTVLGVHKWLANALLILAGLHAAAALMHHYALRDRTLTRMLPDRAERPLL